MFFVRKLQVSVDPVCKPACQSKLHERTHIFLGDGADAAILSIVEICVAIISACLPTYRPLFRYFLHGTAKRPTIGRKSTIEHLNLQYRNITKSHQRLEMQMKDKVALETGGDDSDALILDRSSLGSYAELLSSISKN